MDSMVVETYANPNRTPGRDPKASWTKKHDAKNREGIWLFGYKFHAIVDVNYDIPLGFISTTAKTHDLLMLIPLSPNPPKR